MGEGAYRLIYEGWRLAVAKTYNFLKEIDIEHELLKYFSGVSIEKIVGIEHGQFTLNKKFEKEFIEKFWPRGKNPYEKHNNELMAFDDVAQALKNYNSTLEKEIKHHNNSYKQ